MTAETCRTSNQLVADKRDLRKAEKEKKKQKQKQRTSLQSDPDVQQIQRISPRGTTAVADMGIPPYATNMYGDPSKDDQMLVRSDLL
jgi:hypothetical protein